MISTTLRAPIPITWTLIVYALICVLALSFDLLTDRSFGALMLAALPISLIALGCLLVGPLLEGGRKFLAARDGAIGALLVLLIALAFGSLGAEQAKTGVLVFTYAALIMAFPASLVLPFIASFIQPLFPDNAFVYIITAWAICAASGWLEWKALDWLYSTVRRRIRK